MATKIITTTVDGSIVTFNVAEVSTPLVLDIDRLDEALRNRAMIHGFVQKVSDAAAIPKDEDGNAATPGDKHAAMEAVIERLMAGDWSARNASGEPSVPSGLIFRALYTVAVARAAKGKKPAPTEEAVRAMYDGKDRSAQLAMRNVPEIAAEMERIKSERGGAATKVNAEELFGELEGL